MTPTTYAPMNFEQLPFPAFQYILSKLHSASKAGSGHTQRPPCLQLRLGALAYMVMEEGWTSAYCRSQQSYKYTRRLWWPLLLPHSHLQKQQQSETAFCTKRSPLWCSSCPYKIKKGIRIDFSNMDFLKLWIRLPQRLNSFLNGRSTT